VLIEAVGPDGVALYRRLIPEEGSAGVGGATGARREDVIEAGIQEAWRQHGGTWGRRTRTARPETTLGRGACAVLRLSPVVVLRIDLWYPH